MKKLKYAFLLGFLVLSACTTKPFVSQAQLKQKAINDQFNGAIAYAKECEEKYDGNPDFVLTYQEILLKGINPPNRAELLASNKKLNTKQKNAFQNYIKLDDECTKEVLSRMKGSPAFILFQSTDSLIAIIESNLLTEKVTIGDANAKKLEVMNKFFSDFSMLQQQLSSQSLMAHNSEVAIAISNAAAAAAEDSAAAQISINRMNTATQVRQSQTTQQLLQQNQYKPPPTCLGYNCR